MKLIKNEEIEDTRIIELNELKEELSFIDMCNNKFRESTDDFIVTDEGMIDLSDYRLTSFHKAYIKQEIRKLEKSLQKDKLKIVKDNPFHLVVDNG